MRIFPVLAIALALLALGVAQQSGGGVNNGTLAPHFACSGSDCGIITATDPPKLARVTSDCVTATPPKLAAQAAERQIADCSGSGCVTPTGPPKLYAPVQVADGGQGNGGGNITGGGDGGSSGSDKSGG